MKTVTVTEIAIDEEDCRWVKLSGTDYGTEWEFVGDDYGITPDDLILDGDGRPLTEGDNQTVAVRNALCLS